MSCFHCQGSTQCHCMFCGGNCQACAGRCRTAKEIELADRFRLDVRDIASYFLVLEGAPTIKHRRLKFPPGVYA